MNSKDSNYIYCTI